MLTILTCSSVRGFLLILSNLQGNAMVNNTRRNTLKLLGVGSLSALTNGCSCFIDKPTRNIQLPNCGEGCYPVFDAHAHFFNASDLQAGGYLTGPVLNDALKLPDHPALRKFVYELGNGIQFVIGRMSISAQDELRDLSRDSQKIFSGFSDSNGLHVDELQLKSEFKSTSSRFYQNLAEFKPGQLETIKESYRQAKLEVLGQSMEAQNKQFAIEQVLESSGMDEFNEDSLYQAMADEDDYESDLKGLNLSFGLENALRRIKAILKFAGHMLSARSANIRAYQLKYSLKSGPSVQQCLDITCDFDYWLGCSKLLSPMEDQIKLHEELHNISGGFTLPLLGVNPIKLCIPSSASQYLCMIDSALSRGIYRGIKLYPQIGYSPTGKVMKNPNICNNINPADLDIPKAMEMLYDIVESHNAVVMAHTTNSKGATQASKELGAPKYWEEVLNNRRNLKVNFGHTGDYGNTSGWQVDFLKLMAKHDFVTGDIGFWQQLRAPGNAANFLKHIQSTVGESIFDKLLYGSDWFMISNEPYDSSYLSKIYASLQTVLKDEPLSNMFYKNAVLQFQTKAADTKHCSSPS